MTPQFGAATAVEVVMAIGSLAVVGIVAAAAMALVGWKFGDSLLRPVGLAESRSLRKSIAAAVACLLTGLTLVAAGGLLSTPP